MTALLERLEGAREGSRELGHEVLLHFGWHRSCVGHFYGPLYQWSAPDRKPCLISGDEDKLPNPVLSIDAALALTERVLPGWYCGIQPWFHTDPDRVMSRAYFVRPDWKRWNPVDDEWVESQSGKSATTPALAICAALIRATAKEEAGG